MGKELINKYFKVLSSDYPKWLDEYIKTERMQKQKNISVTCGKVYSKLFDYNDYSSLDHSVGVALIIWNFTHDKKQTLSGLFHDIATPAFKHCVDFLNGDYMNQESTEELTAVFIENSEDIMKLLKRDNIKIEEVCDYHIYHGEVRAFGKHAALGRAPDYIPNARVELLELHGAFGRGYVDFGQVVFVEGEEGAASERLRNRGEIGQA